jgi:hypothetical protein
MANNTSSRDVRSENTFSRLRRQSLQATARTTPSMTGSEFGLLQYVELVNELATAEHRH